MNWLVTVNKDANLDEVRQHLDNAGCSDFDIAGAVPSGDELAIPVTGPNDLPKRVADDALIAGVWRNTDVVLM
jgi:hypothetical protein